MRTSSQQFAGEQHVLYVSTKQSDSIFWFHGVLCPVFFSVLYRTIAASQALTNYLRQNAQYEQRGCVILGCGVTLDTAPLSTGYAYDSTLTSTNKTANKGTSQFTGTLSIHSCRIRFLSASAPSELRLPMVAYKMGADKYIDC